MLIIGAGLGGLIAATQFRHSAILEKEQRPKQTHKALLRFRSDDVAKATGIEFKRVRVHKAVFDGEQLKSSASIKDLNLYSYKVAGRYSARSISNLDPCDRWIAPDDLYDRLLEMADDRIRFGVDATSLFSGRTGASEPIISTIPLFETANVLSDSPVAFEPFKSSAITVARFHIDNCDVYQTVYCTSASPVYRFSITGDTAILEASSAHHWTDEPSRFLELIGINPSRIIADSWTIVEQRFGKISPIDENCRRAAILRLTSEKGIYSLGRFATWRNILLDDLVGDCARIRSMIANGSYHRFLHHGA